jgi:SNF2 family DNA or RNA helicase
LPVLHGLCTVDGRIALWAEDVELPRDADGPAHPFAIRPPYGRTEQLTITLPSGESGPLASTDPSDGRELRPWLVSAGIVDATVFARITEERLGESARFLADVAAFAEDLVARGRTVPDGSARWRAVLSGVDSARFVALTAAMPPACRAESLETDPGDLLQSTMDNLVDAEVRRRVSGLRLSRGRTGLDRWLAAVTGEPRQFDSLVDKLDDWRASAAVDSPVRTCFRLSSPDLEDTDSWLLEVLLQSVDDPSVLIPASQVWRGNDAVLYRWVDDPQGQLLTDLGRASRLHRGLEVLLRQAHPSALALDVDGAHRFLLDAPLLTQAGFAVLLPSQWGVLSLRMSVRGNQSVGTVFREYGMGLDVLVDYNWQLALGDEPLTERELGLLAAAKVPLIRIRGRWLHLDRKRLAAGLDFLRRSGSGRLTAGEVLRAEDADLPLPVAGVVADGWLGDLLSGTAEPRLEPVEPPEGFTARLRPYQKRGLAWLAFLDRVGLGALLADDMGLGKTVQLLALAVLTAGRGPTLVVCPMSVVGNWQREAERFAPGLSVHVHHGDDRVGAAGLAGHDLVITTYGVVARDLAELSEVDWDRVVLDEAQYVKNSSAVQAKAVRVLPARHRVALTGTPVENRLAELWSVMDFLNPGVLASEHTFRAHFAVPIERFGDERAAERLRRITGPFLLRRLKTDRSVLDDLPEKFEVRQLCNLTTEQATLYKAVVDDMLGRIRISRGIKRKGLVLATMTKLKQVCNHPAQFHGDGSRVADRSGKVARLEEILEQVLADGEKALCFTQFVEFGQMLVGHLSARFGIEVPFLHGGTSQRSRDDIVARFQSPDGPPVLLVSLKAGGTGLNLTAASHVVHLDRWWNPAVEDQATDRAFRIGQRKDVQVRKFVCVGTLEERIDRLITEKRALAQLVVGAGEHWLTELSTTELSELVELSPEAVGE